jgi:hypothetical protein
VVVRIESLHPSDKASEGTVLFRGRTAVILHGPALVELAFPFVVEKLPQHPDNYWHDLRTPRVQFELPFAQTA